jgi:hypothetical protein
MILPKVGQRIRFQLYMGLYEEGVVRAILNAYAGTRLRVQYGSNFALITLEAIVQPTAKGPDNVESFRVRTNGNRR